MTKSLAIFEGYKIRRYYDENTEIWYFSVIGVVGALSESINPRDYWFKMKIRVQSEDGLELSTICRQLKMQAPDGQYPGQYPGRSTLLKFLYYLTKTRWEISKTPAKSVCGN